MTPVLGIIASSVLGAVTATSFESIATVTGNGSATTLALDNIPSTYTHLQIRGIVRDARATSDDTVQIYFNTDTSDANYASHKLRGNGTAASASSDIGGGNNIGLLVGAAANTTASVYGGVVVDILDYTNTNKYTTVRSLGGFDANGSGFIELRSGVWMNTAAVTKITFINNGTAAFTDKTTFALYGVKSA